MTDKDTPEKPQKKRKNSDVARRIWLAGIGAYGRAFTEAQEAIKDVTGKGSEVFDDLVQKGEMIEMVGKAKGKQMLGKASESIPDIPDFDIEDRIKAMRARLARSTGLTNDPNEADFEARLSAVEEKLDRVLAMLEKPKPMRKKPVKRTTTQRTKKPASKAKK